MDFGSFLARVFGPSLEQAVGRAEARQDGPMMPSRGYDRPPMGSPSQGFGDIVGQRNLSRDLLRAGQMTQDGNPELFGGAAAKPLNTTFLF